MPNQLYNELNKNNPQNNIEAAFEKFMAQMRGQNPEQIINQMVASGKITQNQLNMAQRQAGQIGRLLEKFRPKYHF